MTSISAQGRNDMTDAVNIAKAATASAGVAAGIAQFLGAALPLYIQVFSALTVTVAFPVVCFRTWELWRKWRNGELRP